MSAKYTQPLSTHSLLKHARSLQQKKFRDLHGAFLVQGPKLVAEMQRSEWPMEALYATEEAVARYGLSGATIVPGHELDRIGTLESGNEVIAVARKGDTKASIKIGDNELVLALDGVSDPGNLGTVIRLADWFGLGHIWCGAGSVDPYNPKCVQASMGGIFRVQVSRMDLAPALLEQHQQGVRIYLATMDGAPVFETELVDRAILVLGSESHGISRSVLDIGGTAIRVPGGGRAESLNVAMAATALCTEFARQRGWTWTAATASATR